MGAGRSGRSRPRRWAAHRAAVRAGLAYLDTHASLSRRGDGRDRAGRLRRAWSAALFDHRTSRCGDPQLHTHALVVNKVRCADGRWRTLDATELFHHKKSAGMIYQAALRNEMPARLGVSYSRGERARSGRNRRGAGRAAEVVEQTHRAVSTLRPARRSPSTRSCSGRTLTAAERAAVVKTAVLKTRAAKQHPELSALHATWTAEAARAGWTPDGCAGGAARTTRRRRRQARCPPTDRRRRALRTDGPVGGPDRVDRSGRGDPRRALPAPDCSLARDSACRCAGWGAAAACRRRDAAGGVLPRRCRRAGRGAAARRRGLSAR